MINTFPHVVLGSGAGTTAESIIKASESGDLAADVCLIVGNNSRSGIFAVAERHKIRSLHLSTVTHPNDADRDAAMLDALSGARADLVVLAGYAKKIGPKFLKAYRGRMINTHPALLPAYGSTGMYGDRVHAAVLADGVPVTGATVHLVTENYDEGPVLDQQQVQCRTTMTSCPCESESRLRRRRCCCDGSSTGLLRRVWTQTRLLVISSRTGALGPDQRQWRPRG